jgi:hypothetical protein
MDRGRIIDNIQNTNARFIDKYGTSQKTSIRLLNPPGGKTSFSLGWEGNDIPYTKPRRNTMNQDNSSNNNNMIITNYN